MESAGILKRAHEDGHLGNEAREAGQTEVGQTGDDIAHRKEWHDLHQTSQTAYVTRVCTTVYHTDEGEEEGRHKSV